MSGVRARRRAVVFLGPTLPADLAMAELDADYRPPAAQGDLYRAALARPAAIGLVDGYFAGVPAVWHKEILWALEQGIPVYGSASMGALRAVELAEFGMVGVGTVVAGFRDGRYEADDEVAVAHGPAESGYRAISEALVNIRATVAAACAEGVIDGPVGQELVGLARSIHYPERSYPRLLADAAARGTAPEPLDRLRAWLPTGRVDAKRRDAVEMLVRMRTDADAGGLSSSPGVATGWRLEETQVWAAARLLSGTDEAPEHLVADELRLRGEYRDAYVGSLLRHLALDAAVRLRLHPAAEDVADAAARLRASDEAPDPDAASELTRLARENATLRLVESACYPDIQRRLPDQVRVAGDRSGVVSAAARKAALLAARGGRIPSAGELGTDMDTVVREYFAKQGRPVPDDLDGYARSVGFASADALRRALLLDRLDHIHRRSGNGTHRPASRTGHTHQEDHSAHV